MGGSIKVERVRDRFRDRYNSRTVDGSSALPGFCRKYSKLAIDVGVARRRGPQVTLPRGPPYAGARHPPSGPLPQPWKASPEGSAPTGPIRSMIGAFQAGRRRHPYELQNSPPSLAVRKPGPQDGLLLLLLSAPHQCTCAVGLSSSSNTKGQDAAY